MGQSWKMWGEEGGGLEGEEEGGGGEEGEDEDD